MLSRSEDAALLLGRLFVAALFLPPGFAKLMAFSALAASLAAKGIPYPTVIAGLLVAAEFLGPLSLIIGLWPHWTALVLIGFIAATLWITYGPSVTGLIQSISDGRPSGNSRRQKLSSRRLSVYVAPNVRSICDASLRDPLLRCEIEALSHLLSRFEDRHELLRDLNGFAGTRIAPSTSAALFDREGPEATKLDSTTLCKSITDGIKDRVHDLLDVTLIQMRVLLSEFLDQFGFNHACRKQLITWIF
jgi:putative oxidoreductase